MSETHQVIQAQATTNQPPDVKHLSAALAQVEANCGQLLQTDL